MAWCGVLGTLALLMGQGRACHRRSLSNVITHLDSGRPKTCQQENEQCKFDRNCCAGLECKMADEDFSITTHCQYRLVYKNYEEQTVGPTWLDYQEMEYSQEGDLRVDSLGDLERRNADLRRKLAELEMLKKTVSRQQLVATKKRLEDTEIEELKNEKLNYEKNLELKMKRLKETELQNELESLEKKEVNNILSKQHRASDLYKEMLSQLSKKEN